MRRSRNSRTNNNLRQFLSWLLYTLIALALILGITSLILVCILYTKGFIEGNSTNICDGCPGIISIINTDNSTSSLINQTLNFNGECGIETFINSDNITITDLRGLSPYIVGQDGCSEFLTPQDAYNQAILDGKGGDTGPGAVIIIKPGNYDFTGSQFPILQSGIVFKGLSWAGVYFTSSDTTSGIYTNISPNASTNVIFKDISFGSINDTNGFLLNISSGRTILDTCYCQDTNFRVYVGKEDLAFFVSYNSKFSPLPPSDFVTSEGNGTITWKDVRLVNNFMGTQGGHVFNLALGFGTLNLFNIIVMFSSYDGIILGPNTLPIIDTSVIQVSNSVLQHLFIGPVLFESYFAKHVGTVTYDIGGSKFYFKGPLITQSTDSTQPGDIINILLFANEISTGNATISYVDTVSVIAEVNIQITCCTISVSNNDNILYIPTATVGDTLDIILTSTTLTTQSAPGGIYLTGPNPALANLALAGSVSLNGATTANGVTVSTIVFLS
jgi:hypothetical protein